MVMVCPQCSTSHDQCLHCPVCSNRLVYGEPDWLRNVPPVARLKKQSPWARILVGLLLSQGVFYALRQLVTGILMAWQGEEQIQALWASPAGFFLIQGMQLIALLASGMLTGSGHASGPALGAIVGIWSGVFSILLQRGNAQQLTAIALYGQPLVQALFGAIGGWLGSFIWKPIASGQPALVRQEAAVAKHAGPVWWKAQLQGQIAWFRVAAGAVLALIGTLTATALFDFLLDVSKGQLATSDSTQDFLFTWEIKALAVLLGGTLAGATTGNGIKQGLSVGLATTVLLIGIKLPSAPEPLTLIALTPASALPLAVAGGWFGSQLFPPVCRLRRKGKLGHAL